jgi:putative transposase
MAIAYAYRQKNSDCVKLEKTCQSKTKTQSEDIKMFKKEINFNASNSLAHTKWNCKYHIVFAPKYRRKVFFEEKRLEIREILRTLCQWKGVEIIEGEVCPDHIHILVSIPPKLSVSSFMGYLKGKSSLMIFQKYGNLKFAYRNREFWCKGYYVDTVGKNTKAIKEYIGEQLKRDHESDQLSMYDPKDPFTGSK